MNITTTLEQSKRLKVLGAPQDTHFHYEVAHERNDLQKKGATFLVFKETPPKEVTDTKNSWYRYAAYTIGELIDWLGDGVMIYHRNLFEDEIGCAGGDKGWYANIGMGEKEVGNHDTPLDALVALAEAVKSNDLPVTKGE